MRHYNDGADFLDANPPDAVHVRRPVFRRGAHHDHYNCIVSVKSSQFCLPLVHQARWDNYEMRVVGDTLRTSSKTRGWTLKLVRNG